MEAIEMNWTDIDSKVLALCPDEGWFGPHEIKNVTLTGKGGWPRRPKYRCDRLVEHGHLERRVHPDFRSGLYGAPEIRWQYRRTPKALDTRERR